MNQYLSRVLKIVVFLIIVVIADQVVGKILRKLYFNRKGQEISLTYAFRDCKADLLIFGNSRAQHHYDPRIISDYMKMSCYNTGQGGGESIIMHYAQIMVITKRYSPKVIILDFHPNNIVRYAGDYDRLSILLPYYKEYPEIRPLILLRSPYERVKLLSAIYPFNSKLKLNLGLMNMIRFYKNPNAPRKQDFQGFLPLKGKMNVDMLKPALENETQSVIDTNMVNALKNIIRICKEKNISLFIVSSPIFHTDNEKQTPYSSAAKLSLEIFRNNKVNYLDFTFDSTFAGHLDWFKDRGHLNEKGAAIFTRLLIQRIKIDDMSEKK